VVIDHMENITVFIAAMVARVSLRDPCVAALCSLAQVCTRLIDIIVKIIKYIQNILVSPDIK